MKRIELRGTYGRLTILNRSQCDGSYWHVVCQCGKKTIVKTSSLISGKTKSCGCLRKEKIAEKLRKNNHDALYRQKYIGYKNNAKRRGREFTLTFKEFKHYASGPCFYCGRPGVNTATSSWDSLCYNGIDRLYNHWGYDVNNIVSCCGPCNMMKGNLSAEEFILRAKEIANYNEDLS